MNAFDFSNLASDTSKNFRLEAFSFTYDFGLNIYFDDMDNLKEIIGDSEIEFWQVEGTSEGTYMDVDNFNALEKAIELIEEGHFQEDLNALAAIVKDGYANDLDEAKTWKEDNYFSEDMNDYDFGYYMIHELGTCEISEHLQSYFDYEKYGKECKWDFVVIGDSIYNNN